MNNWRVISWLVIDYCRWSMSNRWLIDRPQNFQASISYWLHRLLIDVIDYLSIESHGYKPLSSSSNWWLIHRWRIRRLRMPLSFVITPNLDGSPVQIIKLWKLLKYPMRGVLRLLVQSLEGHSLQVQEFRPAIWVCAGYCSFQEH